MRRFTSNRLWILILALAVSVVGVASMPSAGYADKGSDGTIGSDTGDPTNTPDPQGAGDPDSPSGNGRTNLQSGGDVFYGTTGTVGVGDASVKRVAPAAMMRLRIALGMLKYYYLRF